MPAPAGAGHTVLNFIHSGSSARLGIGLREFCVPGIDGVLAFVGKDALDTIAQVGDQALGQQVGEHHVAVGVQFCECLDGIDFWFGQHIVTLQTPEVLLGRLGSELPELLLLEGFAHLRPRVDVSGADHFFALPTHHVARDALAVR